MLNNFNVFSNPSGLSGEVPSSEIVISTKEEIPNPLVSGYTYLFDEPLTLNEGEEIVFPDNAVITLKSTGPNNGITYTGDSTLLQGSSIQALSLEGLDFTASGTSTLIDLTGANAFNSFTMLNSSIVGFNSLGTATDLYVTANRYSSLFNSQGFHFLDCPIISMQSGLFTNWNNDPTRFLSIFGTCTDVLFNNNVTTPGSSEYVMYIDSGIETDSIQIVGNSNNTYGRFFDPVGLNQTDKRINVSANSRTTDSTVEAYIVSQDNSTATVISAANTPVKTVGTFVERSSERMTTTDTGRITYVGLEDVKLSTSVIISTEIASGVKIPCAFYVNHGNDTNNIISAFADAGGGEVTVTVANWSSHTLANSDRVVITGTTNYNGTYTISSVSVGASTTTFNITATWVSDDATGYWSLIESTSKVPIDLTNSEVSLASLIHREEYKQNEYIEIFFENQSTTNDATMEDISIIVAL